MRSIWRFFRHSLQRPLGDRNPVLTAFVLGICIFPFLGLGTTSFAAVQQNSLAEILQQEFLHNTVQNYLIALGTLLLGIVAIRLFEAIALPRLKRWAVALEIKTGEAVITFVEKSALPIFYGGLIYLSLKGLLLHPTINRLLDIFGVSLFTFLAIRISNILLENAVRYYWLKRRGEKIQDEGFSLLFPSVRVVVWTIGVIFFLENIGLNLSAVVASLGIGGVAIALASKGVLQDLFSYYSILLDRPFEIGDLIVVGEFSGTVESVGIKTTRIKSVSGEQLIFSNTDLTSSRLKNFKRMERRRAAFVVRVSYSTELDKLREIPTIVKNIIEAIEHTSFDRAHFSSYGEFSLNFDVVYYVLSNDYKRYMDIQEQINLAIHIEFNQRDIEFAYQHEIPAAKLE
ncbi:Mechanosensitive ion channel family protein [Tumidithrix helvetica PCC 7403]|uniref:mechanosensitive ion channel family protein n=1 Tax=Tumidithrix helvetica TaxID=3457545 RepID=UPI003C7FEE9D